MGKLARQLRRSWKFIAIWLLLIAFALWQKAKELCATRTDSLCLDLATLLRQLQSYLIEYGFVTVAIIALLIVTKRTIKRLLSLGSEQSSAKDFKNAPWIYDRQIIKLTGRVEKVIHNRLSEKIKRKIRDLIRTATNDDDQTFRNIHLRFLISSPMLRDGKRLLVEHNEKFGKVAVKKGESVSVQGEYIHRSSSPRGNFAKGTPFYGRIHSTYPPKGYIRALGKNARTFSDQEVEIVSRVDDSDS